MRLPPLRVNGVQGAHSLLNIGVSGAEVATFSERGLDVNGVVTVRGRPLLTRGEVSDAAFIGGCYGALTVILAAMLAHALRQALKAARLRAWLARQPAAAGDPYRSAPGGRSTE